MSRMKTSMIKIEKTKNQKLNAKNDFLRQNPDLRMFPGINPKLACDEQKTKVLS